MVHKNVYSFHQTFGIDHAPSLKFSSEILPQIFTYTFSCFTFLEHNEIKVLDT